VLSIGIFFTLMIIGFSSTLPATLAQGLMQHGVAADVAERVAGLSTVSVLFAAFLGYNPIETLVGPGVLENPSAANRAELTGHWFFSDLISKPFHSGLTVAFAFAAVVCLIRAVATGSPGGRYVHDDSDGDNPYKARGVKLS